MDEQNPKTNSDRLLIAIPATKTLQYGQWESTESPLFDKSNAYLGKGYGSDIHFSGPNPRITAVRETWASKLPPNVDFKFFYGGELSSPLLPDEILLNVADDYQHLPHKVLAVFRWALEQGYSHIFKCDDDTYVWVDRLITELPCDYGGYAPHGVVSGGPGYFLSRRMMEAVLKHADPDLQWAEDVMVGQAINRVGRFNPKYFHGHRVGGPSHWYDTSRIDAATVTIHAVRPDDMRTIWNRENAVLKG